MSTSFILFRVSATKLLNFDKLVTVEGFDFFHSEVSKTTREAVFYVPLGNLGDPGKDRYWVVVFSLFYHM